MPLERRTLRSGAAADLASISEGITMGMWKVIGILAGFCAIFFCLLVFVTLAGLNS